jgi:hypothetical protein
MTAAEHDARDYLGWLDLPDGRHIDLMPLTFGRVRLAVSTSADHTWIDDVYDYEDEIKARHAMMSWDGVGEPDGWTRAATPNREMRGFRRRGPDGEVVRP